MKRIWLLTAVGVILGAVAGAGWFYWSQWGCTAGCSITGSPVNSSLYGAFMGGLLVNSVRKEKKNEQPNNNN